MAINMKENGKKIKNGVGVQKFLKMETNMLEYLLMVLNKVFVIKLII